MQHGSKSMQLQCEYETASSGIVFCVAVCTWMCMGGLKVNAFTFARIWKMGIIAFPIFILVWLARPSHLIARCLYRAEKGPRIWHFSKTVKIARLANINLCSCQSHCLLVAHFMGSLPAFCHTLTTPQGLSNRYIMHQPCQHVRNAVLRHCR